MATNCNTPLSSLKASSSGSTNVGTVELFVDENGIVNVSYDDGTGERVDN